MSETLELLDRLSVFLAALMLLVTAGAGYTTNKRASRYRHAAARRVAEQRIAVGLTCLDVD